MAQLPLPPVPELPPLPKGASPPAAVLGVIGVPDVMRLSLAAQAIDRTLGERREKLNDDAQKEQDGWRAMQQTLANDRAKLSPEQVRAREKELNDRITNSQRQFRDRNRILQEQTQFALNAIQASLIAVIRQVAESRGMNMVLHRAQVALNVNEFDITDQVADQLNKILPLVLIPSDGVSPVPQAAAGAPTGPAQPALAPGPRR
jgi:Skp family chaperone for outer membrane proteins